MMDAKLDVLLQVRELVALGVENSEAALAPFLEAVAAFMSARSHRSSGTT